MAIVFHSALSLDNLKHLAESRKLFGIYPPKIAMWSRSSVDVIGNLSGLKAVVFLW